MTETGKITAHTAALALLKGLFLLLTFIINIYLARILGAEGYGIYAYYTSIIAILSSLAVFGSDRLVLRELSSCSTRQAFGEAWGLLKWSGRLLMAASLSIIAVSLAYAFAGTAPLSDAGRLTFMAGLPLIPLAAFLARGQSSLQAVGHPVSGRIAEDLIQPTVFLLALAFAINAASLQPHAAMGIRAISFAVSMVFVWLISRRILARQLPRAEADSSNSPAWASAAFRFALINLLLIAHTNINIFMLQWMLTSHDVGIYAVAQRGADLINILSVSLNLTFAPAIVKYHHINDTKTLERTNARLTILLSAAGAAMALAFFIKGALFLSLFGEDFVSGHRALYILAAGKSASMFFGPVALLLVMTGNERLNLAGIALSALANIILNVLLIPSLGIEGAAIASTAGLMLCCIIMLHYVRARLGINPAFTAIFVRG